MASQAEVGTGAPQSSSNSANTSPRLRLPLSPASSLWTAADVARYLRSSLSFVYKVAEAGKLPCLRVGSMLRFDPDDVRAFARGDVKAR